MEKTGCALLINGKFCSLPYFSITVIKIEMKVKFCTSLKGKRRIKDQFWCGIRLGSQNLAVTDC